VYLLALNFMFVSIVVQIFFFGLGEIKQLVQYNIWEFHYFNLLFFSENPFLFHNHILKDSSHVDTYDLCAVQNTILFTIYKFMSQVDKPI